MFRCYRIRQSVWYVEYDKVNIITAAFLRSLRVMDSSSRLPGGDVQLPVSA